MRKGASTALSVACQSEYNITLALESGCETCDVFKELQQRADEVLPTFIGNHYAPYNMSIATSASTSSVSVWSDASSQSSDDSATSVSDSDSCDSFCARQKEVPSLRRPSLHQRQLPPLITDALPAEQRQNPRRTVGAGQGRSARLPSS